jgi:hypothetical protein
MAVLLLNEPRPICKGTFSSMENPAVASEFANSAGNVCVTSCKVDVLLYRYAGIPRAPL